MSTLGVSVGARQYDAVRFPLSGHLTYDRIKVTWRGSGTGQAPENMNHVKEFGRRRGDPEDVRYGSPGNRDRAGR